MSDQCGSKRKADAVVEGDVEPRKKPSIGDLMSARLKACREQIATERTVVKQPPKIEVKVVDAKAKPPGEGDLERREREVGVVEYLGTHAGFTGAVKRRNCDFVVREVDVRGEVVKLSTLNVPTVEHVLGQERSSIIDNEEEVDKLFGGRWKELVDNFGPNGACNEMR